MPIWTKSDAAVERVDVLLFDRFSNHCLANAVEPLRAANSLARRPVYEWRYLTLDGRPAVSSSGLPIMPNGAFDRGRRGHALFVMPSYGFRVHAGAACLSALRSAAPRYAALVGMDTGAWLLAAAGLLTGRRATIHWDEFDSFAERFPEVQASRTRFVVDGDRLSCGGAMTAFDLVLTLIGARHGEALRLEVASLFMQAPAFRAPPEGPWPSRTEPVAQALKLMQEHLEQPLAIGEIARRVGRSQKDLERRFRRETGASPRSVYRRVRLAAVRTLAENTALSIGEIGVRCGYGNASAMTRAFVAEFGYPPRTLRSRQ